MSTVQQTHTSEPWKYVGFEPGKRRSGGFFRIGEESAFLWGWDDGSVCGDNENADTARIISCVNACAGMADPAAEIAAMKEALKLAKGALGKIYDEADNYADGAEDAPLYAKICNEFAHIAKPALAAINRALEEQP